MARDAATQLDLFALIDQINATPPPDVCPHRWGIGKNGDGWTLEHDPASPHHGRWVDSNPNCRMPGY